MKLSQALNHYDLIVENGPLGTRLKYDYGYENIYNLYQDPIRKQILINLYKDDLAIAQDENIPIILNAATFRASRAHLAVNGVTEIGQIRDINLNNLQIIAALRDEMANKMPIFLGAPLGSMFDAYKALKKPSEEEAYNYHKEQISFFKEAPIDFINAVTLPTLSESLGIAKACDESEIDYTIGFVLGPDANLLDGTTLNLAIDLIDEKTSNKPVGFLITCTHSSIFNLLDNRSKNINRLIGFQANGSCLPLSELDKANKSITDNPEEFSIELKLLKDKFNLKILGGCCGTSKEHLYHIIKKCKICR